MKSLGRFFRRRQNLLALAIIAAFVVVALAAPILAPVENPAKFSPFRNVAELKGLLPVPPGPHAYLGTVATGILRGQLDIFYTLVWGTRSALTFGLLVTLTTALLGISIGAIGGFLRSWPGTVLMRITDAFLAFPLIAGVVIFQQLALTTSSDYQVTRMSGVNINAGPSLSQLFFQQIDPVVLAFILFLWMPYARLTYTMVLQIKDLDYVDAARALGAGGGRILIRHLIPNSISPAVVLAARDIALVVILQASLTFIGVVSDSEWGTLLAIGRRWIIGQGGNPLTYWWTFLPATVFLILFGVGWNLLGDGLNDWLNPHQG